MPRVAKVLTMAQIRKLPRGRHAVGGGLVVRISANSRWILRRYLDGKQRDFDLGGLEEMTPEEARAAAAGVLERLKGKRAPPATALPVAAEDDDNPFVGPIARALLAEVA